MIISHRLKNQKGIATLVTVIVLLIATTITAFIISSSIINEKQVVADEQRAIAAFEAAQSGLSEGVVYYRQNVTLPSEQNISSGSVSSMSSERWYFWGVSTSDSSGGVDWTLHAKGESDDGVSVIRQVQIELDYPKLDLPNAPLVTAAGGNFGGGFTVTNQSGGTTIWSGGSIDISSKAFSTRIPSPVDEATLITSTTKTYRGSDLIENDPNLASLSYSNFQKAFLGTDVDTFCENTFINQYDNSDFQDDLKAAGSIVCIEDSNGNDITIPPNTFDTPETGPSSIYVIKGNLDKANSNSMKGLIFVTGDISSLASNTPFYGTVLAQGEVGKGNGTADIIFNTEYISDLGRSGKATAVSGSWRDW